MISVPKSWNEVFACSCLVCLALKEIYARCQSANEPLFVCDCRMHTQDRPWTVPNVNTMFDGAVPRERQFDTMEEAVSAVLKEQRHCDVFLSSWPLKQPGSRDYLWHREEVAA